MDLSNWKETAHKYLKKAADVADIVATLHTNTFVSHVTTTTRILSKVIPEPEVWKLYNHWVSLPHVESVQGEVKALLLSTLPRIAEETVGVPKGYCAIENTVILDLKGSPLLLNLDVELQNAAFMYVPRKHDPKEIEEKLRELVWSLFDGSIVCAPGEDSQTSENHLCSWSDSEFSSERAKNIAEKQKKFLSLGKQRAILLYGEPGTGKSCAAKEIGAVLGGRVLHLQSLNYLDKTLKFLQPTTVIIDDLDRCDDTSKALRCLDDLSRVTKLVIVTVNYKDRLDPATLRRFSEVIPYCGLDKTTIKHIKENAPKECVDRLLALPVVYVSRYFDALESLGASDALHELTAIEAIHDSVQNKWKTESVYESEDGDHKASEEEIYTVISEDILDEYGY